MPPLEASGRADLGLDWNEDHQSQAQSTSLQVAESGRGYQLGLLCQLFGWYHPIHDQGVMERRPCD